ncbi:hypothetical protein N7457_007749 [Penicillium paradoxum]|uniref:uncharacterized protein n=1 Tax=Penicillium paradoxum TaxID=176176 RepID=UPI0025470726|nr:uncharacterized protein N7457_007749 [Penicillium paradoxum]KAJ5772853.1 hypothetical protein N7457_007749 [Penicillium paradoxum]
MTSTVKWLQRLFSRCPNLDRFRRSFTKPGIKFPISLPTSGWKIIRSEIVEEEHMEAFADGHYFPVALGDILPSRLQIVGKLGWGVTSTVWLVRDLKAEDYMVLKIFARDVDGRKESVVYDLLADTNRQHLGSDLVRTKIAAVTIPRPDGEDHFALLQAPLWETLRDLQERMVDQRLDQSTLKLVLYQVLLALDYLHTECKLIHTDIKGDNIFLELEDKSMLDRYVQAEIENPSPRKIIDGKTVYRSRLLEPASNLRGIELGDFGSAVPGDIPRNGEFIQPSIYRAPEVMLEKAWNYPVDIWNLAVWAWNDFQGEPLFKVIEPESGNELYSTDAHLAQITGLLGSPPSDFVEPDTISTDYFDQDGNWIHESCKVQKVALEDVENRLEGEEKEMFLDLMKGMLQWRPEDRKTARELLEHPWLQGVCWPPGCYKPAT